MVKVVTNELSGVVAHVGHREPIAPGVNGKRGLVRFAVQGGLSFEIQARSRFGHAATENNLGLEVLNVVTDGITGGGVIYGEVAQQQGVRGEILPINRLLDQIVGGVRSLMR